MSQLHRRLLFGRGAAPLARVARCKQASPSRCGGSPEATRLIVSGSGNDAIDGALRRAIGRPADALGWLTALRTECERRYRATREEVLPLRRSTAICTPHHPYVPDPALAKAAGAVLALLKEVLASEA